MPVCPILSRRPASIWGPQDMARYLGEFARAGLINIAGGCCGNTPEHIAAIAKALDGLPPRKCGTKSVRNPMPGRARAEHERARREDCRNWLRGAEAPPPLRLAALHPAARRLHHDRRADQRGRFAQIRQADQGRQIRGSGQRGPAAGREWRQRHRHLHGRGHDRRRRGHDPLPAVAGQRARGRQGSIHGGLVEVGGDRGWAQMPSGQGHRELDLAEGRRGEVSPATPPRC